ncbi:hypothetical protein Taro_017075 [Colocasia esculenta]|uniref:Uncharacterized protein n=1 Tax=Colocasia esculenta TaxID=4460 RepID=A0A843US48_COLES|nr:hypothetical protein [Colocasia esculenta]
MQMQAHTQATLQAQLEAQGSGRRSYWRQPLAAEVVSTSNHGRQHSLRRPAIWTSTSLPYMRSRAAVF